MADFPVTPSTRVERYEMTGGETSLPVGWPVFGAGDIRVLRRRAGSDTVLLPDTDYLVGGIGAATGTVTLVLPALPGDLIAIVGAMPIMRATDYVESGDFTARAMNVELDRVTAWSQEIGRQVGQSLRVPDIDRPPNVIPNTVDRAGRALSFDSAGDPVASVWPTVVPGLRLADRSQLRAQPSPSAAIVAETLSADSVDDGGGGLWSWSPAATAADDAGTVLMPYSLDVAQPGRWLRLMAGRAMDPRWWGAKADGIHDDTAALAAAIQAANSVTGAVALGRGTYRVTGALPPLRCSITGHGPACTRLHQTQIGGATEVVTLTIDEGWPVTGALSGFRLSSSGGAADVLVSISRVSHVRLRQLQIDGVATHEGAAIRVLSQEPGETAQYWVEQLIIDDVRIADCMVGLLFDSVLTTSDGGQGYQDIRATISAMPPGGIGLWVRRRAGQAAAQAPNVYGSRIALQIYLNNSTASVGALIEGKLRDSDIRMTGERPPTVEGQAGDDPYVDPRIIHLVDGSEFIGNRVFVNFRSGIIQQGLWIRRRPGRRVQMGDIRRNGDILYLASAVADPGSYNNRTAYSATGPVHTSGSAVDGDITWDFLRFCVRRPSISVTAGDVYYHLDGATPRVYQVATSGTTDTGTGPSGTGSGIVDGTATWDYVGVAAYSADGVHQIYDGTSTVITTNDALDTWSIEPMAIDRARFGFYPTRIFDMGSTLNTSEIFSIKNAAVYSENGVEFLKISINGVYRKAVLVGNDEDATGALKNKYGIYIGGGGDGGNNRLMQVRPTFWAAGEAVTRGEECTLTIPLSGAPARAAVRTSGVIGSTAVVGHYSNLS